MQALMTGVHCNGLKWMMKRKRISWVYEGIGVEKPLLMRNFCLEPSIMVVQKLQSSGFHFSYGSAVENQTMETAMLLKMWKMKNKHPYIYLTGRAKSKNIWEKRTESIGERWSRQLLSSLPFVIKECHSWLINMQYSYSSWFGMSETEVVEYLIYRTK